MAILRPGGLYVSITGVANDVYGDKESRAVSAIGAEYNCDVHFRSDFFSVLADTRLVPIRVQGRTLEALPYCQLRTKTELATGVEQHYLETFTNGSFNYLLGISERI